jgi:ABC-type sulfate transport system substrate-binding protein
MAKWIAVFAICSVTVFAQSTLADASQDRGQEVISRSDFRPTPEVARKHANKFESIGLVRIDDVSGGWARAQKTQFVDGGTVDQICGN